MIIDIHTHCFPDAIARRAVEKLENTAQGKVKAVLDGTVGALLKSMEEAQVGLSVIQPIATRPGQEKNINNWASSIQGAKICSFGTIHPDSSNWRDEISRIADLGLKGIKLHPDYQGFFVQEPRMFPIYEAICEKNLILLLHCGVDLGFPEPYHCIPVHLKQVIERFPEGRWIAAHMGGWSLWEEVEQHLLGLPVYLDTSFCRPYLSEAKMVELIRRHGVGRVLYGSDSPWAGQRESIDQIATLNLSAEERQQILGENAAQLLKIK
ncbi:MAG TPA: amidohydrolase family protein [Bacillota bacterium]|jgi:predicted TIM-barrel fold metal-dependent hydrolase|nr:amidohydrolase family protein [Bacillota bacterium]HOL09563.1 amidohydrolase family protein [Bacillota bacterium]HPO97466.1 amidohydrolase family protein [Bacillota bacterium]